ncbi:phosphatase PAP2 family protein [Sandarakinorhabdus sp.]|uniref:phosphatase PAP2 family protein n=1 Tax=Sandarakinorhabdus sp. TaxID=1916663 RepID=UPI00334257A4
MLRINLAILSLALPAAVAAQPAMMIEPARPAVAMTGYLADRSPLTLVRLLPPPPLPGSSEDSADRYLYRLSKRGIGGPDWRKAQGQLGIGSPDYQKAVACALGAAVAAPATANTMKLLQRAGADLARAVTAAKEYHKRARPFTTDRGKACDPASAVDGGKALGFAYPSGHAAVGWLWGLILADARPERSAALLKFGKETGDLRIACRVHWASDVAGGRLMATALYQQIADTADYKADLAKASAELSLAPVPEGCPAG